MSKIDVMVCTSASILPVFINRAPNGRVEPHIFIEDLGHDILSHVLDLIELHLVVFWGTCEAQ